RKMLEYPCITLIAFMVVVLIIGLLIFFSLPTFPSAIYTLSLHDALPIFRNGIAAAKTAYTDFDAYTDAVGPLTAADLMAIEPSLSVEPTAALNPGDHVIFPIGNDEESGPNQVFASARLSASGMCYYLTDR